MRFNFHQLSITYFYFFSWIFKRFQQRSINHVESMNKYLTFSNIVKTLKPLIQFNFGKNIMTPEPVPSYEIKDGIRYVKPYLQDIKTTVKTRWLRRTVLDILSSEFRSFDAAEYKKRMENGDIAVLHHVKLTKKERKELKEKNLPKSKHLKRIVFPEIMSYKMEDNDVIDRLEHIHERSVIALNSENVEVIFENDDILVVNKPSGIPIHPVQNYFYNSFVKVLEIEGWPGRKESGLTYQLRPCYRLDKLTSGVCIFAKSTQVARNIQMQIQNRDVEKVYLARVKGKFPAESDIECLDDVIVIDTKKGKQDGIMRKSARTIFQFVGYNKNLDESIVMCYPKTGRTHQIRIHLRNLNHPIINDPLYGPNKLMCLRENQTPNEISDEYFEMIKSQATLNRIEVESNECCEICNIKLYKQSPKEDLTMYLHAYKYKLNGSDGWSYQTTWPEWCNI